MVHENREDFVVHNHLLRNGARWIINDVHEEEGPKGEEPRGQRLMNGSRLTRCALDEASSAAACQVEFRTHLCRASGSG